MNFILLILLYIFGLFYQVLTLNEIVLLIYIPNILVPLWIFSHFYLNINYHTTLFFLLGLSLDSSNPLLFGTFTLSFMVISYLVTVIRDHLDLHIFANKLVLISLCNAVFYTIYFFFAAITYRQTFISLILDFIISTILNTIFSIIIIGILDFIKMLRIDYSDE